MSANKRKKFWGSVPKNKLNTNSNRFAELANVDIDDDDDDTYSEGEVQPIEFKVVIPPIVVDAVHSFSTVYKKLGVTYQFKRMSIGTKVLSPTLSDFCAAKTLLTNDKFLYYTHDVIDRKMFKLVLFGLPKIDVKAITEELKDSFNVTAVNVKEITTSRSSADDAIYMLEFDRSQHKKSDILKIRYLRGIVVHWKNPSKNNRGPTFCTKCTMYGHGTKNCFRKNICIACGGGHDFSTCTVNKTDHEGTVTYKCFNCVNKGLKNCNHRADDPRCPSRKDYIIMRQNLNNNNSIRTRKVNYRSNRHFSNGNNRGAEATNVGTTNFVASYSDALKNGNQQRKPSDDLFTVDELFNIFTGAIDDLRKCSTKAEQLNVIMSLLKHAI